jgi:hypothetical protein
MHAGAQMILDLTAEPAKVAPVSQKVLASGPKSGTRGKNAVDTEDHGAGGHRAPAPTRDCALYPRECWLSDTSQNTMRAAIYTRISQDRTDRRAGGGPPGAGLPCQSGSSRLGTAKGPPTSWTCAHLDPRQLAGGRSRPMQTRIESGPNANRLRSARGLGRAAGLFDAFAHDVRPNFARPTRPRRYQPLQPIPSRRSALRTCHTQLLPL